MPKIKFWASKFKNILYFIYWRVWLFPSFCWWPLYVYRWFWESWDCLWWIYKKIPNQCFWLGEIGCVFTASRENTGSKHGKKESRKAFTCLKHIPQCLCAKLKHPVWQHGSPGICEIPGCSLLSTLDLRQNFSLCREWVFHCLNYTINLILGSNCLHIYCCLSSQCNLLIHCI